jgi:hypothetical protein
MANFLANYDDSVKKIRDRIVSVSGDSVAPSPSEKVAREELKKLVQNSEEIRKIKEKIEKKDNTSK